MRFHEVDCQGACTPTRCGKPETSGRARFGGLQPRSSAVLVGGLGEAPNAPSIESDGFSAQLSLRPGQDAPTALR